MSKLSEDELKNIAKNNGLNDKQADAFVVFFGLRFPNEQSPDYVAEWARRIKNGSPESYADEGTLIALIQVGFAKGVGN